MKLASSELKAMARKAMRGKYAASAGALMLVYVMIMAVVMAMEFPLIGFMATAPSNTAIIVFMVIFYAFVIFGIMIAEFIILSGLIRFYYHICTDQPFGMGDLLYGVKNHPARFIGLSLIMAAISIIISLPVMIVNVIAILTDYSVIMLWLYIPMSLVTLILSIFIMLRYALAFLILVENPDKKVFSSLHESAYLMKGNRGRLFCLGLSFIGIFLLGCTSMGIGFLWIAPYFQCTFLYFYLDIKREKEGRMPLN